MRTRNTIIATTRRILTKAFKYARIISNQKIIHMAEIGFAITIGLGLPVHMARTIHAIENTTPSEIGVLQQVDTVFSLACHTVSQLPLTAIIEEVVFMGTTPRSRKLGRPHPVAGPHSMGPALCMFCKLRRSLRPP
jgi:hypothetical protein